MARTELMRQLLRLARPDGTVQGEEASAPADRQRRRVIQGAVAGAASIAGAAAAQRYGGTVVDSTVALTRTTYARLTRTRGVAVIGAGVAGLACARELERLGIAATVYEASGRVGGRCLSERALFPGQVAERGADFIGASHHVMLGYARELQLELADMTAPPGRAAFHFDGRAYTEAQVRAELGEFIACIGEDLQALAGPTASTHDASARLFDLMSLDDYLLMYGAGGMLRGVIGAACAAEFGAAPGELSAIAFLRFVHGDARGKFASVSEAPRFHVVEGMDRITSGLAARLARPVQLEHRLVSVRRLSGGTVRMAFDVGGRLVQRDHDAVVLALPFSVLRDVDLHGSLGLPAEKRNAIQASSMGDATKLLVGFQMPVWYGRNGASGQVASDLGRLQTAWEAAPSRAGMQGAVLAHLAGGSLARGMRPETLQSDTRAFLGDLERALPGASAAVRRNADGTVHAACENWTLRPQSRGAYPCPRPGYFTTIAHHEATPVDNVYFAGDHTSSFYEWQGFMEGAALSGLRAAYEASRHMLGR